MLLLEDRRFYVYIYLDPRKPVNYDYCINDIRYHFDYEPFYVGKGKGRRMFHHLREAKNIENNNYKVNKIRSIKKENLTPVIIKIREFLSESESFILENRLIISIGRIDLETGSLVNLTDGGEGGVNLSLFSRKKIGDRNRGRVLSKETRYKISINNAKTGTQRQGKIYKEIYNNPEEWLKNHSEARKGNKNPMHKKGGHSKQSRNKLSETRLREGTARGNKNPRWKEIDVSIVEALYFQGLSFKDIIKEYNIILNTNTYGHSSIGRVYNKIKDKYKDVIS
jgi:hypothetical protein